MKIALRHKWALKVARRYYKPAPALAAARYMNFVTAVLLLVVAIAFLIKFEWKFPQLSILTLMLFWLSIFFVVIGLMMIERRAFSELLKDREEEIQKLRGGPSVEQN
jgi:hypothetical protein